ncbi:transglutaminase family protein [Cerasicoccus maritimus]|uniref:transglutaminase family protein n=1 Tax=Cerasicoccus maritimus TaxID=490089 RepID=UPI0028524F03|nr:transglutaminase family protein [Cerasicoccus maritimus]
MKISIDHLTRYHYSRPVSFSEHHLFLRPRDSHKLRVENFELTTSLESAQRWIRDCNNNIVLAANFGLLETQEMEFHCRMTIDVEQDNPFDFILEPYATSYPFRYLPHEAHALSPYLDTSVIIHSHKVLDWLYMAIPDVNRHPDSVQFLADINHAVHRDIAYARRDEEGVQSPNETLEMRLGSCRDMAVLFIAACRQLGLAARFVSGYLYDPPVDSAYGDAHLFNRAVGSMHAWAEVFLPGAGWKGFDPTNGILANEYFIPSAVAHEPKCVNPIQGKYFAKGGEPVTSEMEITLSLEEVK